MSGLRHFLVSHSFLATTILENGKKHLQIRQIFLSALYQHIKVSPQLKGWRWSDILCIVRDSYESVTSSFGKNRRHTVTPVLTGIMLCQTKYKPSFCFLWKSELKGKHGHGKISQLEVTSKRTKSFQQANKKSHQSSEFVVVPTIKKMHNVRLKTIPDCFQRIPLSCLSRWGLWGSNLWVHRSFHSAPEYTCWSFSVSVGVRERTGVRRTNRGKEMFS